MSDSATEPLRVVLCTVPDADTARAVARALVEEHLAACVNVIDRLTSIYRWKGSIEEDAELLLVIKTRAALFDALAVRIDELHPYSVPEVVGLDVAACHAPYARWLVASTLPEGEPTS